MPRKFRHDAAWMHSRTAHAAVTMPAVELDRKKNIRSLGAPISHEWRVRRRLKVGIVQVDIAVTVSCRGKVHQTSAILDQLRYAVHKHEVTQVIRAELRFEAILCLPERSRHHAGIGDEYIEQTTIGSQLVRSSAHTLQARQIEFNHLETRSALRRGLAYFRGRAL